MRTRALVACLLASTLFANAAVSTNSLIVAPPPLQLVTCHDDVDVDALLEEFHISVTNPNHIMRNLKIFAAPLDEAMIQRLKSDPRVLAVEADGPVGFAGQWDDGQSIVGQYTADGLLRMGIPQFPLAHINGRTEPIDVDVAVLDSGVGPHNDLNVFDHYTLNPVDKHGHGTEVAGVIGALDNGFGVVGVAPGVRIWNVQVSRPDGTGTWTDVLSGMSYVLQNSNKISVANMSFVNEGPSAPLFSVRFSVKRLVQAGIVVVAAAGNEGVDLAGPDGVYATTSTGDDKYPAAISYAMAVSAVDTSIYGQGGLPRDQVWEHSNYSQVERTNNPQLGFMGWTNYVFSPGGAIDVAAPGVNILTTTNNGYKFVTGTSYAAPHVAGLVALYIAANGRATNEWGVYRIRQAIVDNALPQSLWHTNNTLDPDTNPEPLAIASEAWIPKPVITNITGGAGNYSVKFATVPGYDYTVQATTNLTSPIPWADLHTVSGSSNVTLASVTDTNVADQSFYRLARKATVEPPLIIAQPLSWEMPSGGIAKLRVSASGSEMVGYVWHQDGVPLADGGNISGATSPSLVLTNVQLPDVGAYTVVATNFLGSATSAVATVTIRTNLASSLVTGVLATATSEYGLGRYASNTLNGIYFDPNFWESGLGDFAPAITFDLGAMRSLEKTVIWNGHELDPSIKRMSIAVSSDGVNFHSLGQFTLTTQSPASEALMLGGVVGRFVRFTIHENGVGQTFPAGVYGASNLVAIDEVEFHEYQGD